MSIPQSYFIETTVPDGTTDRVLKLDGLAFRDLTLPVEIPQADNYSFSAWVKCGAEGSVSVVLFGNTEQFDVGTEWQRIEMTVDSRSGDTVTITPRTNDQYLIYRAMLETGNKPSDWSPSPADDVKELHNSSVNITPDGIDMESTGVLRFKAGAGSESETAMTLSKDGVSIASGGHLEVEAQNLEIRRDGSLSATNAFLSGDIFSGNNPVLTRGGDVVVSTTQPTGHAGMIWIKPNGATSVSAQYSFNIPWGAREALYNHPKTGTLSGYGAYTSFTNCNYTLKVPIYLREHSGTPAGGTLKCTVSDGTHSIVFTATVTEGSTGTGNKLITMTAQGNVWIGAANSLSFTLTAEALSGYYVYNILNSYDTSSSITLSCTASGQQSGWVDGDVKVFV